MVVSTPGDKQTESQEYRNYRVVRQEHLNQYGSLFGGYLLQIIDELAFIACAQSFPGRNFVTRALDEVEFHAPARLGDILETVASVQSVGRTSVQVRVRVFIISGRQRGQRLSFDGVVVLVRIDENGVPAPVRPSDESEPQSPPLEE